MESSIPEIPKPRRRFSLIPVLIVVFMLVTSVLASGTYYFLTNSKTSNNDSKTADVDVVYEILGQTDTTDWNTHTIDEAAINFKVPQDFDLSKIEINYFEINSNLLQDTEKRSGLKNGDIIKIGSRAGLVYKVEEMTLRYFPTNTNGFIEIKTEGKDELTEDIIQTIEFNLPLATMN